MIQSVKKYLLDLQQTICAGLEKTDGNAQFSQHRWQRKDHAINGNGISCILTNGGIFEQAGVNFSQLSGVCLPASASVRHPELAGRNFNVLGVSLVVHPRNPFVPTSHANVRFFIAEKNGKESESVWWFGGGFDLTPYYAFTEDCVFWHTMAKAACEPFGEAIYAKCKQDCDDYFYLKHRDEQRGIGGLFFDDYNQDDFPRCFAFMQSVGNHYLKAYQPIVEKRKGAVFNDYQRQFQLYRRGRYVEFNLVYDRGTLFGLQTGGRAESILMSMPPLARWEYEFKAKSGSQEEKLINYFLKPQDWLNAS